MKWSKQFATLFLILLVTGCAGHSETLVSANTLPLPQVKWQSDAYTLIAVPQVHDIFYLNDDRKHHFLSYFQLVLHTLLKTKRLMGTIVWRNT